MTNREKYAKEILNIVCAGEWVAVKDGKLHKCGNIECGKCDLNKVGITCRKEFKKWCNAEYGESQVDWTKVPVDTPIWVRDAEDKKWVKRHFAKYEGGRVWAYRDGTTSWVNDGIYCWTFVKLATDDELNTNSILRTDGREKE